VTRRIVVTGLGAVTPVGLDVASTWDSLIHGRSGIARISRFDPAPYETQIAGEVKGFDVTRYLPPKEARRMDTFVHYGLAAAIEAIKDAGIQVGPHNAHRIGVNIGSGIGGLPMIEDAHDGLHNGGARKVSPYFVPGTIINMVAGNLSILYGFKGPNLASATACAAATHCIGESGRLIEYGDADVMICGGAEGTLSPLRHEVAQLVEELTPVARRLDCEADLQRALVMAERPSYMRQRDVVDRGGSLRDVVDSLIAELRTDTPA